MLMVSLGAGLLRFPGWVHVDADPACQPDLVADLSQRLPFDDGTVDFLHSEDFIGQLDFAQAGYFARECFRVLKPGGALRLLTPDLHKLVSMYQARDPRLIELWTREVGIPLVTGTHGELVHTALTFANQSSFFDEETLRALLEPAGFLVNRVDYRCSAFEPLRTLDIRTPGNAISLYLECCKPGVDGAR
ncbi:MAG TPA: methyltransferase domain-containing protein [Azoarcus taiwanensis]|nr:methyltransferase domain-containing protein [Azoarcus taiwanensis]